MDFNFRPEYKKLLRALNGGQVVLLDIIYPSTIPRNRDRLRLVTPRASLFDWYSSDGVGKLSKSCFTYEPTDPRLTATENLVKQMQKYDSEVGLQIVKMQILK